MSLRCSLISAWLEILSAELPVQEKEKNMTCEHIRTYDKLPFYIRFYSRGQWWNNTKHIYSSLEVLHLPLSITVPADRLQVIHGLPLVEAEAV